MTEEKKKWRAMIRYRRFSIWFLVRADSKQEVIDKVIKDAEFKKRNFVAREVENNPDRTISVYEADTISMVAQEQLSQEPICINGKFVPRQLDMYYDIICKLHELTPAQKEAHQKQELEDADRIAKELESGHYNPEERIARARKRRAQQIAENAGQFSKYPDERWAAANIPRAVIVTDEDMEKYGSGH